MDFKTKKMKHTIKLIIIFSIVFTSNLNAQVNLEFNQVVNMFYPYAGSGSTSYDLVVPEGKVLKTFVRQIVYFLYQNSSFHCFKMLVWVIFHSKM